MFEMKRLSVAAGGNATRSA